MFTRIQRATHRQICAKREGVVASTTPSRLAQIKVNILSLDDGFLN
jgi:hypothetical protein